MKAGGWGRIIFISSESAVNIPVDLSSATNGAALRADGGVVRSIL
jgi:hypothetical protein